MKSRRALILLQIDYIIIIIFFWQSIFVIKLRYLGIYLKYADIRMGKTKRRPFSTYHDMYKKHFTG